MLKRARSSAASLRRSLSRSHLLTRLLRLPVKKGDPSRTGLLLIQIDGLSRPQLERALDRGEMPFLERLRRRQGYRLHSQYSGLPAATPAVQAELFYGVRTAVPAFSFRQRETGEVVRMYEPDAATRVENRLQRSAQGLLAGGSVYADNFTGGAEEAHFCPSSLGWGHGLRTANPFALLFFLVSNLYSFLRTGALLAVELVLAVVDFARGLSTGHDFVKELKFIPTRVAISILMRELCVIGGKIDLYRGLPVLHINFLGYDEQAHRRGPDSAFAHWTLQGIDDAIARLWRAARRASWRSYEVWVYSDHGQHAARHYEKVRGYSIEHAVNSVFAQLDGNQRETEKSTRQSVQTHRVILLGARRLRRLFAEDGVDAAAEAADTVQVAALGPVGFVYAPFHIDSARCSDIARALAREHDVPVAVTVDDDKQLHAWCGSEAYLLPQQTAELFGEDHPFLHDIGQDLADLCRHPEAGCITLLGWRKGSEPVTFAVENGSHAGLHPDETHAFCLLPHDAPLAAQAREYHRAADLRRAVLQLLDRRPSAE